jgi:hypothetical protein
MNTPNFGMPQGAWADGNILIVSRGAVLPPFCVKCGRPSEPERLKKSFRWHPGWVYIFILIGILFYVILAAVLSKRMTLELPLCRQHLEKYRTLRIAAPALLLGSIAEMVGAGALLPGSYLSYGIGAGLLAFVAGIVCLVLYGILGVNRIDQYYGYFAKSSDSFLLQLPRPPEGMMILR